MNLYGEEKTSSACSGKQIEQDELHFGKKEEEAKENMDVVIMTWDDNFANGARGK